MDTAATRHPTRRGTWRQRALAEGRHPQPHRFVQGPGGLGRALQCASPGFHHRGLRLGIPEVIYAEGKTEEDSKALEAEFRAMVEEIMQTESAAATP